MRLLCLFRPHRPTMRYRWVGIDNVVKERPVWFCARCGRVLLVEVDG